MESVLWSPLTDYHRLSPICHVLSRISFAFYITRTQGEEKKIISTSSVDVERVNLLGWLGEQM